MPLKIPFFRLGKWKHPIYGEVNITERIFAEIKENFKKNVLGRPPFVRIGHDKPGAQKFGYAPAEGWVTKIRQEGDVLYAEVTPTTPEAEENIRTKRYRFSSAEYTPQGTNRETGQSVGALLSAIALTNEPFLTKLPEATLLADQPDTFYMDFAEMEGDGRMEDKNKENEGMLDAVLQKLSDLMNGLKAGVNPAPAPKVAAAPEGTEQKLAALEAQIAELTTQNQALASQIGVEAVKRHLAEVEREAAAMVAQGIPPVMVGQWKTLALSVDAGATIKLADDKGGEVQLSQAEAMKKMLLALPAEHRIKFSQTGTQSAPKPEEEIKLSCDADVLAMGGAVDAKTGKYMI